MIKFFAKKILILTIIFSIFSPTIFLSLPKKTNAITVVDVKQLALNIYSNGKRILIKVILQQLTMAIVDWINNGFQGNPAFVTDPENFLTRVGGVAIGEYIYSDPNLRFLCDPFKIQVQLALSWAYQPPNFKTNCTLSEVLDNVDEAYESFASGDFINGGGWDTWFKMSTNLSDTPQGAFLIAKSELEAKLKTSQEASDREVGWGEGSWTMKNCKTETFTINEDGERDVTDTKVFAGSPFYKEDPSAEDMGDGTYKSTKCVTGTPGQIITEKLRFADTSFFRTLELESVVGESIDAIGSALINQLLTKLKEQVTGMIKGSIEGGEDMGPDYDAMLEENLRLLEERTRTDIGEAARASDPLASQKEAEKNHVNQVKQVEERYFSVRSEAKVLMTRAIDKFTITKNCPSDPEAPYRGNAITDNVIKPMRGLVDGKIEINGVIVNIKQINDELPIAGENIDNLNSKLSAINSATTLEAIFSATSDIDSAPYHKQEDIKEWVYTTGIQNWIKEKINNYAPSGKVCPFTFEDIE